MQNADGDQWICACTESTCTDYHLDPMTRAKYHFPDEDEEDIQIVEELINLAEDEEEVKIIEEFKIIEILNLAEDEEEVQIIADNGPGKKQKKGYQEVILTQNFLKDVKKMEEKRKKLSKKKRYDFNRKKILKLYSNL